MSSQLTGSPFATAGAPLSCRGRDESLGGAWSRTRPIETENVRDTLAMPRQPKSRPTDEAPNALSRSKSLSVRLSLVIDEAVSQRRVVSRYLCTGPRRSNKPRAGNGNTDLTPGSDSLLLPCGQQVDRCTFTRCRSATHPSPRHHVTGRKRRLPPLLAMAGSFARRPSVAAPFVLHCPSEACKANCDGYRRSLAPGKV